MYEQLKEAAKSMGMAGKIHHYDLGGQWIEVTAINYDQLIQFIEHLIGQGAYFAGASLSYSYFHIDWHITDDIWGVVYYSDDDKSYIERLDLIHQIAHKFPEKESTNA